MTLNRAELRSWLKLIGGMRALLDALDRQLRVAAGISHDDYAILARLHREPGRRLRMSELAGEVGFSPSRLSHAIARLETEGWVRRTIGQTDRRVVVANLTDAGVLRVHEVSPDHLSLVRKLVFDTLGPERAREAADAFDEIRRAAAVDT